MPSLWPSVHQLSCPWGAPIRGSSHTTLLFFAVLDDRDSQSLFRVFPLPYWVKSFWGLLTPWALLLSSAGAASSSFLAASLAPQGGSATVAAVVGTGAQTPLLQWGWRCATGAMGADGRPPLLCPGGGEGCRHSHGSRSGPTHGLWLLWGCSWGGGVFTVGEFPKQPPIAFFWTNSFCSSLLLLTSAPPLTEPNFPTILETIQVRIHHSQLFSLLQGSPSSPISLVMTQPASTVSGCELPLCVCHFVFIPPSDFKHPGPSWCCSNLGDLWNLADEDWSILSALCELHALF